MQKHGEPFEDRLLPGTCDKMSDIVLSLNSNNKL